MAFKASETVWASKCATIAQWIRLRIQSCHPGFESQAHHLSFYQFVFELCLVEKTKTKQKEAVIGTFLKNSLSFVGAKFWFDVICKSRQRLETYSPSSNLRHFHGNWFRTTRAHACLCNSAFVGRFKICSKKNFARIFVLKKVVRFFIDILYIITDVNYNICR